MNKIILALIILAALNVAINIVISNVAGATGWLVALLANIQLLMKE